MLEFPDAPDAPSGCIHSGPSTPPLRERRAMAQSGTVFLHAPPSTPDSYFGANSHIRHPNGNNECMTKDAWPPKDAWSPKIMAHRLQHKVSLPNFYFKIPKQTSAHSHARHRQCHMKEFEPKLLFVFGVAATPRRIA